MREKIEFLLQDKRMSASTMARHLGIQPSGLSHILSGRNKPSFDLVVKILRAFPDVNPDWLLLDSDVVYRSSGVTSVGSELSAPAAGSSDPLSLFAAHENIPISESSQEQKSVPDLIFGDAQKVHGDVERVVLFFSDRTFLSYKPR